MHSTGTVHSRAQPQPVVKKVSPSRPQQHHVFIPNFIEDAISDTDKDEYDTWVTKTLIPSLEKYGITFRKSHDRHFPLSGCLSRSTSEAIDNCLRLLYPLLPCLAGPVTESVLKQHRDKTIFLAVRDDCLQHFQHIKVNGYTINNCRNDPEVDETTERIRRECEREAPASFTVDEPEQTQPSMDSHNRTSPHHDIYEPLRSSPQQNETHIDTAPGSPSRPTSDTLSSGPWSNVMNEETSIKSMLDKYSPQPPFLC